MKANYNKRLEHLRDQFPDHIVVTTRWLETLTNEELISFVIFIFAIFLWWNPNTPRVIELPGGTLELDEVTPQGNESVATAICRHYGLDYRRTIELVNLWHRI